MDGYVRGVTPGSRTIWPRAWLRVVRWLAASVILALLPAAPAAAAPATDAIVLVAGAAQT